jgi:hypothetical protein
MPSRGLVIVSALVLLAACSYDWSRLEPRPAASDASTGVRCDPLLLTGCGPETYCSAYMPASGIALITCAVGGTRDEGERCEGTGICRVGLVCWADGEVAGGICREICTDTIDCGPGTCDRSTAIVTPARRIYPCRL